MREMALARYLLAFLVLSSISLDVFTQIYQPGVVIFKIKSNRVSISEVIQELNLESSAIKVMNIKQIFPEAKFVGSKNSTESKDQLNLIYQINIRPTSQIFRVINELKLSENVIYAQPKYLPEPAGATNDSLIDRIGNHLRLIGAFKSWAIQKGDSSIKIGIIDTGTDLDHPDLVDNMYLNHGDPINGIDDDGDGYTDNFWGWDLAENDNNPQSVKIHHGVHMCGIVGAVVNNTIGVAGIGNGCKFMVVKISDDTTGGLIAAYEGVKYAADAGCQIINCSWGGYFVGDFEKEVIDYAVNVKNSLVVASAGNDDRDDIFYPAAFDGVLAVGNVDTNDFKAFNSNFNERIDVSAPGVTYTSTWNDNLYQSTTGTSVSSTIVAGGAGLLKSKFPNMSNEEIIDRIKGTSTYIDYKNELYSGKLGAGRLEIFRALENKISPNLEKESVRILPNPILSENSELVIHWINKQSTSVEIEIFSLGGNKVHTKRFQNMSIGNYKYEINVESLAQGLYFVKFKKDGTDIIQKLVVQ